MTIFHLVLLAIIQGVTEFLPVSSSGHLVLLPMLTPLDDQGPVIDVAVHVGTLAAVCWYLRAEVALVLRGLPEVMRLRIESRAGFLALCLTVATIPVILFGLVIHLLGLAHMLRSITVIGWAMILFGIALYIADRRGPERRHMGEWTLKHAITLGLWQVVALIPGTSRAGIVITGARALGYHRQDAAKLSMLMSIPTIAAAGLLLSADVLRMADWQTARDGAIAAILAFFAAWVALVVMMRLARRVSFTPYVIYRVILGAALLALAYS